MDLTEEIAGRVTRSKLKRLGSVESDAPSRPVTPLNKLVTIAETDSPSRPMRSTRRNSVNAGSGTPLKNSMLNKTAEVSTPRKVGRPRNVVLEPQLKDENDTPGRRVTRSQSISPPNSDSLVIKTRGRKISPKIEDLPEEEEESDKSKPNNEESSTYTEMQENKSPKKRNASESSKSVCFNDSAIDEAEKTVYPKTPLHLKSIHETKENINVSNYGSFNELFNEDNGKSHITNDSIELDDEQAFNMSKSTESKLSKISSTPKITQQLQIKLRKVDDDLFKKKLATDESTPVKQVDNLNEIVEISSGERSKAVIEDVEMKSPKTPNEANTSKQDNLIISSEEKSRKLLLDSMINEDGKVDCSQKRISLRYEKLQESLLLQEEKSQSTDTSLKNMSIDDDSLSGNESKKSINLSKLKTKSPGKTSGLNKSMPEQKSAEMADKCIKSRYSTSNLLDAQITTIPLIFENEDATEPKEDKLNVKNTVIKKEKLSKSFNDIIKEKKSNKKERHSMAEINFSQPADTSKKNKSFSTEKLNNSKAKEAKCSDIEESNEKMEEEIQVENTNVNTMLVDDVKTVKLNDSAKNSKTTEEEEKEEEGNTTMNTFGAWGTMNVHGSSNQKIDSIHFNDNKENNELIEESETESIDISVKKKRKNRMQLPESSDEEKAEFSNPDEEEAEEGVELAENEKPYKFNAFTSEAAMEAEESYESGDSLESELEELMQENEIPTHAEDLGSEDTDVSESDEEEEEDDDSFIASDNEEELLDYDDYDEGINLEKKKHKRLFVFSSDSSDVDEEQKVPVKKPMRNRSRCISSDDSEDEKNTSENKEKEKPEEENVPMVINSKETNVNNSRKSVNQSQLEKEHDLIEVEENIEEQKEIATKLAELIEEDHMEIEENSNNNESLNKSKNSLKKTHEMEVETEVEATKTENKNKSPKKIEIENEQPEMAAEMPKSDRKRKRMSQSFCENTDMETVHKHKKSKLNEITVKSVIDFEEDQPDINRIQERCDDMLEAANQAKLEAKKKAKQEKTQKLSKENKTKRSDQNEENCDVDSQKNSKELDELKTSADPNKYLKDAYSRILKTASMKFSNEIVQFEDKVKSKQLSVDVLKAIAEKDGPVKQKKVVKKMNKKQDAEATTLSANKLITSAGEVRVIPCTPPIDNVETIATATGIVRVEPITPKLTQKAGILRESPVTPFSIGFRVRKLMGEEEKLPECPNNKRIKKRKLALDVDEPANKLLQPQWTTSGVFKVENKQKVISKKVLVTSNNTMKHVSKSKNVDLFGAQLGAAENALKFKMNAMSKGSVPTESSSKILQRKKRQQVQKRF